MTEKVNLRKKDEELEDIVIERLGLDESVRVKIKKILRYNMLTPKQVADLTDLSIYSITNKTRPKYDSEGNICTELDVCYPFIDITGQGPKFIVRNEKLDQLLRNGRQRQA
jgi:hypothetical protein